MSRQKKRPHGHNRHAPRPTKADKDEALIADTLRIFTCFTEITHDFLSQCAEEREHLECDSDYNRLAIQMWTGGPGHAAALVEVLNDYLAARERHLAALAAIQPRLAALLATPAPDHLDPSDRWRDLIRRCVAPPAPPAR